MHTSVSEVFERNLRELYPVAEFLLDSLNDRPVEIRKLLRAQSVGTRWLEAVGLDVDPAADRARITHAFEDNRWCTVSALDLTDLYESYRKFFRLSPPENYPSAHIEHALAFLLIRPISVFAAAESAGVLDEFLVYAASPETKEDLLHAMELAVDTSLRVEYFDVAAYPSADSFVIVDRLRFDAAPVLLSFPAARRALASMPD